VHGNRSPLPLRRITTSLLLLVAMMAPLPTLAASTDLGISPTITAADLDTWDGMRAGVGIADATWNVGAAAGQYSDIRQPQNELEGETDPHLHATAKKHSYGVQSRLTIRAIVVEGTNGERVALVKSDNYLAQDHLLRRVGQLLGDAGSQVTYDGILHAASHNHSSPYYATPSWGVWLFQDVVDLRMFEYQARSMADAILEAEASLAPARMGATVVHHNVYKGNIMRPKTAVDGSPAGFPNDYGDKELTVLRFDTLTQDGWDPLAVWMNWGQHPESLDSYDLITADFLAPLERYVDRDTGAMLVFSQGDVGSAEGPTKAGTAAAWPTARWWPGPTSATRRPNAAPASCPTPSSRHSTSSAPAAAPSRTTPTSRWPRSTASCPVRCPTRTRPCPTAGPRRRSRVTPVCRSWACPTAPGPAG
jgi:hypothetical protein